MIQVSNPEDEWSKDKTYSHVDQITAGAVRELDGVDSASRPNDISDVGHRCARGSTKVQHLGARLHVDGLETTQDTGSKLTPEGVPDLPPSQFHVCLPWPAA